MCAAQKCRTELGEDNTSSLPSPLLGGTACGKRDSGARVRAHTPHTHTHHSILLFFVSMLEFQIFSLNQVMGIFKQTASVLAPYTDVSVFSQRVRPKDN